MWATSIDLRVAYAYILIHLRRKEGRKEGYRELRIDRRLLFGCSFGEKAVSDT